ncbi:MAG: hypothetical protein JSS56_00750 [Proteobacteria bacterium]|nr:hypothetical protein [Pseudomonadota bacterium]
MLDFDVPSQAQAVRSVLAERGPRAALALLNDRTNFRFTALYKLEGGEMRAVHAFDRTSEYRTWLSAVPLESSFCRFAIEHGEFMTEHASADERLARPYAGLVESYYGHVLRNADGSPAGTFIHFDLEPRSIEAQEQAFLRDLVPLFGEHLD